MDHDAGITAERGPTAVVRRAADFGAGLGRERPLVTANTGDEGDPAERQLLERERRSG